MRSITSFRLRAALLLTALVTCTLLGAGTAAAAPAGLITPVTGTLTYAGGGTARVTGVANAFEPVGPYQVRISLAAVVTVPGATPVRCLAAGTDSVTFSSTVTTFARDYRLVPPNPVQPAGVCGQLGVLPVSYTLQFDATGGLQAITATPGNDVVIAD